MRRSNLMRSNLRSRRSYKRTSCCSVLCHIVVIYCSSVRFFRVHRKETASVIATPKWVHYQLLIRRSHIGCLVADQGL